MKLSQMGPMRVQNQTHEFKNVKLRLANLPGAGIRVVGGGEGRLSWFERTIQTDSALQK